MKPWCKYPFRKTFLIDKGRGMVCHIYPISERDKKGGFLYLKTYCCEQTRPKNAGRIASIAPKNLEGKKVFILSQHRLIE